MSREFSLRTKIKAACAKCQSSEVVDYGTRIACKSCGASTVCFTATLGEYQREEDAAAAAWNKGEVA